MTTASQAVARIREALEAGPTLSKWLIRQGDEWTKDIVTLDGYSSQGEALYWNLASCNKQRDECDANLNLIASANPHALRAILDDRGALRDALEKACAALDDSRDDVVNTLNSYVVHPANNIKRARIEEQIAMHDLAISTARAALAAAPGGEGAK